MYKIVFFKNRYQYNQQKEIVTIVTSLRPIS